MDFAAPPGFRQPFATFCGPPHLVYGFPPDECS
jgi:hypothetical protein